MQPGCIHVEVIDVARRKQLLLTTRATVNVLIDATSRCFLKRRGALVHLGQHGGILWVNPEIACD